jgi:hypothetical protein
VRNLPSAGTLEIALAKVKRDLIECALFPLLGLCQPKHPAFGIQRGALPAHILLAAYLHELVHEPHSGVKPVNGNRLSRTEAGLSQLTLWKAASFRGDDDSTRRNAAKLKQRLEISPLVHDPEKWTPVFRKDHAQTKG